MGFPAATAGWAALCYDRNEYRQPHGLRACLLLTRVLGFVAAPRGCRAYAGIPERARLVGLGIAVQG
jgi:hypothetical protein